MAVRHMFSDPDRFVVGAIGDVDERTYVIQVREGRRLLTLPCDPLQIEALANHVERVLDEVASMAHGLVAIPAHQEQARDVDPLDVPLEEDFSVGTMAIGWDGLLNALHIELFSEAGGTPGPIDPSMSGEELAEAEAERARELCQITLDPARGREFVARARAVLVADLPSCPLCAQAIRPAGHVCPRRNGYLGRSAWQPEADG